MVVAMGIAVWLVYDISARFEREVMPGEVVMFQFEIVGALDVFEGDKACFVVSVFGGGLMMCSESDVFIEIVMIRLIPSSTQASGDDASAGDSLSEEDVSVSQGSGLS